MEKKEDDEKSGNKKRINQSSKVKKNTHLKILNKYQKLFGEKIDTMKDIDFNKCWYCTKVFINSKFLIKHVLRRHSENLVLLHRKLCDASDFHCNTRFSSQNESTGFISNEFSKLRKEVSGDVSSENIKSQNNISENKQFVNSSYIISISNELQDLKATVLKTEALLKNLEQHCRDSNLKSKTCVESTEIEAHIYNSLKDNVLDELKAMKEKVENNNVICQNSILELKTEIERLEQLIHLNSNKINSSHQLLLQEIDKKLEYEMQFFLNSNKSLSSKMSKKRHTNMSNDRTKMLQTNRSKMSNKSEISVNEKFRNKEKKEIELLFKEKLHVLNIPLTVEKLSSSEYDKKLRLVQSEKELLNNKYNSFSKIRQNLDHWAEESVLKKMERKKSKKLRFNLKTDTFLSNKNKFDIKNGESKNILIYKNDDFLSKDKKISLFSCEMTPIGKLEPQYVQTNTSSPNSAFLSKLSNKLDVLPIIQDKLDNENECKISHAIKDDSSLASHISAVSFKLTKNATHHSLQNHNETDIYLTKENRILNKTYVQSNSSASLKLIDCSNGVRRTLPNLSPSTVEELSPFGSFDSETDFES